MGKRTSYSLLLGVKALSRLFYRFDVEWVGDEPADPWSDLRLMALLNHTSLFELLFAGGVPNVLLREIATRGVVPAADVTMDRPIVGRLYKMVAPNVVSITRRRDHTWRELMGKVRSDALVGLAPEGRMKRANGLDLEGKPMTVRGGIADILEALPGGLMLIAYSGGLHHVQIPGERLPRLFKTLRLRLECLDIASYREQMLTAAEGGSFKRAVVTDLERRRDLYCAPDAGSPGR